MYTCGKLKSIINQQAKRRSISDVFYETFSVSSFPFFAFGIFLTIVISLTATVMLITVHEQLCPQQSKIESNPCLPTLFQIIIFWLRKVENSIELLDTRTLSMVQSYLSILFCNKTIFSNDVSRFQRLKSYNVEMIKCSDWQRLSQKQPIGDRCQIKK